MPVSGVLARFIVRARSAAVSKRFGRVPHRNAVLGRDSTAQEVALLKMRGSSF